MVTDGLRYTVHSLSALSPSSDIMSKLSYVCTVCGDRYQTPGRVQVRVNARAHWRYLYDPQKCVVAIRCVYSINAKCPRPVSHCCVYSFQLPSSRWRFMSVRAAQERRASGRNKNSVAHIGRRGWCPGPFRAVHSMAAHRCRSAGDPHAEI